MPDPIHPVPVQATPMANESGALNAATVRTAVPVTWAAGIVLVVFKLTGASLDVEDVSNWLILLAPAFGVIAGIAYRLFREVERKWPAVGRIFLGSSKTPVGYVPTNVVDTVGAAMKPMVATETAAAEQALPPRV